MGVFRGIPSFAQICPEANENPVANCKKKPTYPRPFHRSDMNVFSSFRGSQVPKTMPGVDREF
jgi:hypothetical protein